MASNLWMRVFILTLACTGLLHGERSTPTESVVDVARRLNATTFVDFVEKLPESLLNYLKNGKGPFTFFVPTNEAFAKLPSNALNQLQTNKTYLVDVLSFHISEGMIMKANFMNEMLVPTLYSASPEKRLRLNEYNKPTGKVYTASGAPVNMFDQEASNGVVHLLDQVIFNLPTHSADDVVILAAEYLQLDYLVEMSGLNVTTIAGGGPFTFFAPTNDAIAHLPPGAMYEFQVNHMALIADLQQHMVKGTYYTAGLYDGQILKSHLGSELKVVMNGTTGIESADSTFTLAEVTSADDTVTDGVIHGVNRMLLVRFN